MVKLTKKIIFFVTLMAFLAAPNIAYAGHTDCTITTDEPPKITQIVCPLRAGFNLVYYLSGALFMIMGGWTISKYARAMGDPKKLMEANATALWTLVGFVGFLFMGTMFVLVNDTFGLNSNLLGNIGTPYDRLEHKIIEIISRAGIEE